MLTVHSTKREAEHFGPRFIDFFQPTRKLLHVLVARSCMHTDAEPVFLGKVGKFGKFSVKETAFYRLCYTLPCLRAQLQEPT